MIQCFFTIFSNDHISAPLLQKLFCKKAIGFMVFRKQYFYIFQMLSVKLRLLNFTLMRGYRFCLHESDRKIKFSSQTRFAFHLQVATHQGNDLLRNVKAQPGTTILSSCRTVCLCKQFKYFLLLIFWYTYPCIGHNEVYFKIGFGLL